MIESQLRTCAMTWFREGRAAIVVHVDEARGSAPRAAGTRMLVAIDESVGTIGGGHLELKAVTVARAMLAARTQPCAPRREAYALGPSLGQCCGGAVVLGFAALDDASLAAWPERAPLFHLQLHGAGHVGRAIATLLATLDVAVDWFDERDDGFPPLHTLGAPWPAHIRARDAATVETEVGLAPPGAFYLVLTHEHALDLRIVEAALQRHDRYADVGFIGLIGSDTKRASFVRRLEARGVSAGAISRLVCPIGIEGIAAREPEAIALAAVAQLVMMASRRHRSEVAREKSAS